MWWWRRRNEREADLERELLAHLELESADQQDLGLPEEEARYAARRALGNVTQIREEVREMSSWAAMEYFAQDLRYAARTLRKAPGFTAATVFTLALGISANSAIFSVVDGVLLKPLQLERSHQLVAIYSRDAQGVRQYVTQPDLDDWRAGTQSFTGLASWVPQSVNLTGLQQPERITGVFVSSDFFPVLGVSPALGRGFAAGEDRMGGERVAVISNGLWQSRFAADPAVLGRAAEFNGEPYTIVGVLPASFALPTMNADVFLPAFKYPNYALDRTKASCGVIGRLRDGVSLQSAQAELEGVAARLAAAYPASNKGRGTTIRSLKEDVVGELRPSVTVLAGAVMFVLLIGCANAASLLIARMVARERERAIRIALGAGRAKLISYVLSEALVLAGAGCLLGLLLSIWSVPAIASWIGDYLPNGVKITLNREVILFTLAISLASALLVAAIPAWQSSNATALRMGRGAGSSAGKNRTRSILVSCEIALALVLLVGAGLMIRSFAELSRAEPGFDTRNLMMLAYRVPRNKYPTGEQQNQFHREVVEKIKAVPGVLDATSVRAVPMGGNGNRVDFFLTDRPEPPASERPRALVNFADPHFFSTMGIPVLLGRGFNERDSPRGPFVVVINETLARRYFPGRDALGQHLRIPSIEQTGEIVGVVGNVKQFSLQDPAAPQIYGALAQNPFIFTSLAVRTAGNPLTMVNPIRSAIWKVDKDQPVWGVRTFDDVLMDQARLRRTLTAMLAAYAGVALLLASIGLFGLISYSVSQRTSEIGVRMALGARPSDVAQLILRQGTIMILSGIVAGTGIAMWLSRYLRTQLYAVSPLDPAVYATVAGVLAAVAIVACLIPARRATKVDPVIALRYE